MIQTTEKLPPDARQAWVEPEIRALAISETAFTPGTGVDGELRWVDCTS